MGLFCLADWAVRTPPAQARLWDAVGRRVGAGDWFMGNVVEMRRIKIEEATWAHQREVILVGSSQVAAGFDVSRLNEGMSGIAVRRMSVGDMDSVRVLFALPYLCVGKNDVVVWYVSARDVAATSPLQPNWMRPFCSWRGIAEIMPLLGRRDAITSWRSIADLFLAASSELWRSRDYSRHILLNLGGLNDPIRSNSAQDQLQQDLDKTVAMRERLGPAEQAMLEDVQFAALGRALRLLAQGRGKQLIVMEGQLNPQSTSPEVKRLEARLDTMLGTWAEEFGFTYLSRADQGIEHPVSEWKDSTHLNAIGRSKLTGCLLEYFRHKPAGSSNP